MADEGFPQEDDQTRSAIEAGHCAATMATWQSIGPSLEASVSDLCLSGLQDWRRTTPIKQWWRSRSSS